MTIKYPTIPAGLGVSTLLPSMDFETYSEAGLVYDLEKQRWKGIGGGNIKGLPAVGASVYSEHPSTEVLCLAYDLKDGGGVRLWTPGGYPPKDLFDYILSGGLIAAWNSSFEYYIWKNVCAARMGWPEIPLNQYRCDMSKSYAFALPGKLSKAAEVLHAGEQKDKQGDVLIRRLCVPKAPTIKEPYLRRTPETHPDDFQALYDYCRQDVKAEASVSELTPDLSPEELEVWLLDQRINLRGVYIDHEALDNCIDIINQAQKQYTEELRTLTNGYVQSASEVKKLSEWLSANGLHMESLAKAHVSKTLASTGVPPVCRRVLEIRASISAASVKKLPTIKRRLSKDNRLKDLFAYCGADRTGRWAGRGPQPHNLPNSGPFDSWGVKHVDLALSLAELKDLPLIESFFGDATAAISGCLRGLFCAAPGKEFICSDYSAIEAVVLAFLAGEQWRMDVFRGHGQIYEESASRITGIPRDTLLLHRENTGEHHPMRKLGKVAELASGYQGGLGAWKAFGADRFLTEEEIKENIDAWREASPNIVKFWYGLQDAAMQAIAQPGTCSEYKGISYGVQGDILYCRLLSGRTLAYHHPRIEPEMKPWGKIVDSITYWGWNSDSMKGAVGWMKMSTYGGKLTENVVQATARDILAHAMLNLEEAGYPIVLHVHDEIVAEVSGSDVMFRSFNVRHFEEIMSTMPEWCKDWPIKAKGGWRGQRYRKD